MAEQKTEAKEDEYKIIRIMSRDIEGRMKIYPGLTKIKGVSWSISNAVCKILGFDKNKKVGSLSEGDIKKITDFIKNPKFPKFQKIENPKNRKFSIKFQKKQKFPKNRKSDSIDSLVLIMEHP